METFVTVVVLLAMVAPGAFLIYRLNNQHDERIAAFQDHGDGGRGRLRLRRRARTQGK
ncbi:hypothetical protein ACWD1Y_45025 [Streptomyces sp. NPDC002814]